MDFGGPTFVLTIIAMSFIAWIITTAIRAKQAGKKLAKDDIANDYPKIEDGVRGMAFIEAVVASSKANAAWTKISA